MANKIYDFQLTGFNGKAIRASGGQALVVTQGATTKVALQDINGASVTNPVSLTNGRVTFRTATTVAAVDIYIMSPTGHWCQVINAVPGDRQEHRYDKDAAETTLIIPFNIADYAAATEVSTGIVLPKDMMISPFAAVQIAVAETTGAKTMSFGTLSTESGGSATGFGVNLDTSTLGLVPLKSAATATRGTYLGGSTLDKGFRCDGTAKTVSITIVTAAVTTAGFLVMPAVVPQAALV